MKKNIIIRSTDKNNCQSEIEVIYETGLNKHSKTFCHPPNEYYSPRDNRSTTILANRNVIILDAKTLMTDISWMKPKNVVRALYDWNTRLSLLYSKPESNSSPSLDEDAINGYWDWYAFNLKGYLSPYSSFKTPEDYYIDKPSLVAYSKGIESNLTAYSLPDADMLIIENPTELPDNYEGCIAIIGAALGYAVTYVGTEGAVYGSSCLYKKEEDIPRGKGLFKPELSNDFITEWNKYAYPASIQTILGEWNRIELVEKYITQFENELPLLRSCFDSTEDKQWCGNCYKCFEFHHITNFLFNQGRIKHPYLVFTGDASKYELQFEEYLKTGVDPFMNLGIFSYMKDNGYDFRQWFNYES